MVEELSLVNEGRSKNRYLHTVSNAFASHVLSYLKLRPLTIRKDFINIKPSNFLNEKELQALDKLKDISLIFVREPNVEGLIRIPEAGYYTSDDTEEEYGGETYVFQRGEISVKVILDEKVRSFKELESKYKYIYNNLSQFFRHEVEHYVDDQKIEGGLMSQRKERSPYYFLTPPQREEFNYYIRPYEIKAYVKQFMEIAKRYRKPFLNVLKNYVFSNEEFSTFNKNPKIKVLLYVVLYKYLEYASKTYNSVREDAENAKYLEKLGRFLDEKDIYIPPPEENEMNEKKNIDIDIFKDWLFESSDLSKYWKKRAKSRAKRAGRHYPNNQDKHWALEQEEKSKDISSSLKKSFDEQIKESEGFLKQIEEIVAMQTKKKNLSKDPFVSGITGRRKGFMKKHKGAVKVAPGESFGPLEEEDETN